MIATEYLGMPVRLATIVVPVACYFLILGLLNSRRHPKLLTGTQDFVLLVSAMSPLFLLPALSYLTSLWAILLVGGAAALAVLALLTGSQSGSWVIYNLPYLQARQALEKALDRMGVELQERAGGLALPGRNAFVRISAFPLLRNVSIRVQGADPQFTRQLGLELSAALHTIEAQTSPMAMGLLMVATAMLIAPMAVMVQRAPEIVRILTDLLH